MERYDGIMIIAVVKINKHWKYQYFHADGWATQPTKRCSTGLKCLLLRDLIQQSLDKDVSPV